MGADGRPFVLCCYKNESCWTPGKLFCELAHHIKQAKLSRFLSFYQSFRRFFEQAAESGVFSKVFVDTARILW